MPFQTFSTLPGTVPATNGARKRIRLRALPLDPAKPAGQWDEWQTGIAGVAPAITTQPADVTGATGTTFTVALTAAGSAPLTYQWRSHADGTGAAVNIAGATSASYTGTRPGTANTTGYSCVVTGVAGQTVVSRIALVATTVTSTAPTIHFEDDVNRANSTNLGPKWQDIRLGLQAEIAILNNALRLRLNGSSYTFVGARPVMSAVGPQRIRIDHTPSRTSENLPRFGFRTNGVWNANNDWLADPDAGYIVSMYEDALILWEIVDGNIGGNPVELGRAIVPVSVALRRLIIEADGSALRVKSWRPGIDTEPGWQIQVTDASFATGVVTVGLSNGWEVATPTIQDIDYILVTSLT